VRWTTATVLVAVVLVACSDAADRPAEPQGVPSLQVREPAVWLCRAGEDPVGADVCGGDGLDAVLVTTDGEVADPFEPAQDPPVDCFYAYPTVSQAPTDNAPKEPEPAVVATVRAQAALFGEVCRLFVPVYRQVTVAALARGAFFAPAPQQVAYDDLRDAWRTYLNEHNDGRGVVLVGHSQGAMALGRLLSEDALAEPEVRALVVSALLVGGRLDTAVGSDVVDGAGGLPACRQPGQVGCVVGYSAFAEEPPADAFFGRAPAGRTPLCTDPTRLSGGDGTLHPYFPTDRLVPEGGLARSLPAPDGVAGFVAYPGSATAQCREQDGAAWLQVTPVPGAPLPAADPRLGPQWGLHTVDVTLALGDLVEVVRRQADAWPD
jgi:hypothetical protein